MAKNLNYSSQKDKLSCDRHHILEIIQYNNIDIYVGIIYHIIDTHLFKKKRKDK